MHRSNSFNERFSKEIRKPKYARAFILELLENKDEPMPLEEAIRLIARKMGTTDFAELVGERVQNIHGFIEGKRHPKRETLDKFLRPFGLKTELRVKPVRPENSLS
jgi:DNA-binding phage protein